MHDQVKPAGPAYTAGLVCFLLAGLFLLGVYLFGRVQGVFPGAEMHRAVLRLRATLILLGITWYGRHVLLPTARWRNLWWLFLPGLAVIVVGWLAVMGFAPAVRGAPWIGAARHLSGPGRSFLCRLARSRGGGSEQHPGTPSSGPHSQTGCRQALFSGCPGDRCQPIPPLRGLYL